MHARRLLSSLPVLVPVLSLLACGPAQGRSWEWRGGTARLPVADGTLEVTLRPDRSSALQLVPDGPHRWVYDGATSSLVGGSYAILLRNRTGERLKVVVGVDGLNVYGREVVAGSSGEDVGSILQPWSDRTLPGWQLDDRRAQRFVFSPPEWSEGEGRTEAQIGTVTVQVYREWEEPHWDYRDRENGLVTPRSAPAPSGESGEGRRGDAAKPSESAQAGEAAGPPIALRRAPIGTASGDDVDNQVRTVRFVAATSFPESWAVIDYGNARRAWSPPPQPRWQEELLGLDVAGDIDGTRIVAVARGSAADRAGLEADDVIVRIDTVLAPSPATTARILRTKDRGDYTFVRVRRGPHELALKIRT